MTLVVGKVLGGEIQVVADTWISVDGIEKPVQQIIGSAIKIRLLTRKCCIAFAGNVDVADQIIATYCDKILPTISSVRRYTGNTEVSSDFVDRTLSYFSDEYKKQAVNESPADFLVAFTSPETLLFQMRDGVVERKESVTAHIGNDSIYGKYQASLLGSGSGTEERLSRTLFYDAVREHEPHPIQDQSPSLASMISALQSVTASDKEGAVGGFVTSVYSYRGDFYYHSHGAIMRSSDDIDSGVAYAVAPILNDHNKLGLYLGSRESTESRALLMYHGEPKESEEPRLRSLGGYLVLKGKFTLHGSKGEVEQAIWAEHGLELDLPGLHVSSQSQGIGVQMYSKISQFRQIVPDMLKQVAGEIQRSKELSRETWKAAQRAILVAYRQMKIDIGNHSVVGSVAWLIALAAQRANSRRARWLWRVCNELFSEVVHHHPRHLTFRALRAFSLFKLAQCVGDNERGLGLARCAMDELAYCCAKGVLTAEAAAVWVDSITEIKPSKFGTDMVLRHLALAVRMFGQPTIAKMVGEVPAKWYRARLILRQVQLNRRSLNHSQTYKLTKTLSEVWLCEPADCLVNFNLASSLHILASHLSGQAKKVCMASILPYLRKSSEGGKNQAPSLINLIRILIQLVPTAPLRVKNELLEEAARALTLVQGKWHKPEELRFFENELRRLRLT